MTQQILNFPTCHCHVASLDSASTPEAFAAREKELGTGYMTVTDHGSLNAAYKVLTVAKKNGLIPIIGLEAYFRDDDCDLFRGAGIEKGSRYRNPETGSIKGVEAWEKLTDSEKALFVREEGFWDHMKYMHVTMHAQDTEAYEAMCRVLSLADARAEKHGSERKPLFGWKQIEELGSYNVTMTSSCLIGIVQRHLMDHNDIETAEKYFQRFQQFCKPGNFYVEVFPHTCDRNWTSATTLLFEDGTKERIPDWKVIKFDDGTKGQAKELSRGWVGQRRLVATMQNRKWIDREPKLVTKVAHVEDFIMNECRPWAENGDLQKGANEAVLYLAEKYGTKVIIGDDSHFVHAKEKIVQDVKLQADGSNWKFATSYHRQDSEEAFKHFQETLGTDKTTFEGWVNNAYEWASRFKDFKFRTRKSIPASFFPGDSFDNTMRLIEKHGRMRWDDPVWVDRLSREIEMLRDNGAVDLLPYFHLGERVVDAYTTRGILTGAGRGSAAGMLLAYLLRLTHVNPLKYGLSMERFLTASRIRSGKFPDIDQDLSASTRDLLVNQKTGWLREWFGDCAVPISTAVSLKLKSSIKDVARVFNGGQVPLEIEELTRRLPTPPQGVSDSAFVFGYEGNEGHVDGVIESNDDLKLYTLRFPEQWEAVKGSLSLTRQFSRHACGWVIANTPVHDFIPTMRVGKNLDLVTQFTAPSVEGVGGLKMDFLGLTSLDDFMGAIKLIQNRSGQDIKDTVIDGELVKAHEIVPYKGALYSIWHLPEEVEVFNDICEGKTETVFQFDAPGALMGLKPFNKVKYVRDDGVEVKLLDSMEALSAFTALDRPGPLDFFVDDGAGTRHNMLVEYAHRAQGLPPVGEIPALTELLPETYGVIVYQEQLQKIFVQLSGSTAEAGDDFRAHISKKQVAEVIKDKAVFMPGAIEKVGKEAAEQIWASMDKFAQYGFNKSHAVAYMHLAYACAFLKHHFPVEWWCGVLNNASKDEISDKFWPCVEHMVDMPDISLSEEKFVIVNDRIRAPTSMLTGIGETAHKQLMQYRPYKDIKDFVEKIIKHQADTAKTVTKVVQLTDDEALSLQAQMDNTAEVQTQSDLFGEEASDPVESFESFDPQTKTVVTIKKGRNALSKSVIATLIIGGVLDSLFPPGTPIMDMLDMYVAALTEAKGKKRPLKADLFDAKFASATTGWSRYQMRKQIFPAYREDCLEPLRRIAKSGVDVGLSSGATFNRHNRLVVKIGDVEAETGNYAEFMRINTMHPWPPDYSVTMAIVGYVVEARYFQYGEGKKREAVALTMELDQGRVEVVRWGGKDGLPTAWKDTSSLNGAIAVAHITKYKGDKPFVLDDVAVIHAAIPKGSSKESAKEPAKENA